MTLRTKTDEVIKSVSLAIILILAKCVVKSAEGLNVVNVWSPAYLVFCCSAVLASMVVALQCLFSLAIPVRAVIWGVATPPRWTVFSRPVLRKIQAVASGITEIICVPFDLIQFALQFLTAGGTNDRSKPTLPQWVFLAGHYSVLDAPFTLTTGVTEMIFVCLGVAWIALQGLITIGAMGVYHPLVVWILSTDPSLPSQLRVARFATNYVVFLYLGLCFPCGITANGARSLKQPIPTLGSLFQNKPLPGQLVALV